jgi:hypothetical protein
MSQRRAVARVVKDGENPVVGKVKAERESRRRKV